MKEQFDRELRNHIKDTFGDFDDHLADDGWRKLNDRKNRKRRGFIFWYLLPTGIAATLAMFYIMNQGVFQTPKKEAKTETLAIQNFSKDILSKPLNENESKNKKQLEIKTLKKQKNTNNIVLNKQLEASSLIVQNQKKSKKRTLRTSNIQNNAKLAQNHSVFKKMELTVLDKPKIISKNLTDNSYIPHNNLLPTLITEKNSLVRENEIIAKEKASNLPSLYPTENNIAKITQQTTFEKYASSLVNSNANSSKPDNIEKKSLLKDKRFKLSIDANTYVNFSENGVNDAIHLGLGLVSEIKLTSQLSINTGIALNSQNGTFNGNQKSNQDFLRSTVAFSNIAVIPSAQITTAKLVGLDIPLNLKYVLNVGKTTSFITTGFSSYSVINEKYINEFSVINYSFTGASTSNVTNVNNNPEGKFSYFKFARTLDISVGILYPLSKKTTLSIEPFMKYPLSGFGYQNLKIGSSGISFKLNLSK